MTKTDYILLGFLGLLWIRPLSMSLKKISSFARRTKAGA